MARLSWNFMTKNARVYEPGEKHHFRFSYLWRFHIRPIGSRGFVLFLTWVACDDLCVKRKKDCDANCFEIGAARPKAEPAAALHHCVRFEIGAARPKVEPAAAFHH